MKLITSIEAITRFAGLIAALLVLPLIGALVTEVFSRYMFDSPTLWAFEISYMVMGAIFMLGLANALRLGQHVSVDVMTLKLKPRVNATVRSLCYLMFLPIVCWISLDLYHYFYEAFESGERSGRSAWNPVMWPIYGVWFIGLAALSLQILAELLKSAQIALGLEVNV
ncbi:TRAP transporter small permease subunit [Vibrio fluvialis]|uniref:TRAP transporter small permease subunit n=1 Tax=Vibrio fluvialis TaxID=676 RepID=UPI001BB0532F|nr:TRAP transporter small permease subunit [Vibrio fluvialis]EKO3498340.1 TRAP transporter small permease subunit [Vibrio fluvialis]EKO3968100.1 TRAP transporter small permease subunit [Vibrio fluvialis]EKZ8999387.1 TRAP transporter small permease subunit [Vibrio fluvialis]ELI1828118.1 TRAP transporter small permease subunit [Vibrio fluvialis]QUF71661.1 TRAP transporter small permease subunit [Vibrio fluvialis]